MTERRPSAGAPQANVARRCSGPSCRHRRRCDAPPPHSAASGTIGVCGAGFGRDRGLRDPAVHAVAPCRATDGLGGGRARGAGAWHRLVLHGGYVERACTARYADRPVIIGGESDAARSDVQAGKPRTLERRSPVRRCGRPGANLDAIVDWPLQGARSRARISCGYRSSRCACCSSLMPCRRESWRR